MITKVQNFTFTRGDTFIIPFKLVKGCVPYEPQENDEIYFTVKKDYSAKEIVLQKTLSNGGIVFDYDKNVFTVLLEPTDTKEMEVSPKKYYYDIQFNFSNGEVKTYLKGTIELGYEVTH